MPKKRTNRRINYQKIFCFISFIFILTCCIWYGGRTIYFYSNSKKKETVENHDFAYILKKENHNKKTFIKNNEDYYFYHKPTNNYLEYSHIIWRIMKINKDNSIVIATENPLTNLAYGNNISTYQDSLILSWLNKTKQSDSNSGFLEKNLNDISKYLVKSSICSDTIDDIDKIDCKTNEDNYYFGLLSVDDYVKTGGKKGFLFQNNTTYLANLTKDNDIWYLDSDGSLGKNNGNEILGVRVVATLSPTIQPSSGTGTEEDPYIIENEKDYFGGYVKLDEDLWRIYDVDNNQIKLVLTNYVTDSNGVALNYIYSNKNYRHNDTANGSLAYYLNHTFLNSLNYKDLIIDANYYNGYYSDDNNFAFKDLYSDMIDTKVTVPSIGDINFNYNLTNYFIATGTEKNSTSIYIYKENNLTTQKVTNKANVVPCITIKKEALTKGTGTKNDPYTN